MIRPLALALAIFSSVPSVFAEDPEGFIRVVEDDASAKLQTGVTRYEKDGAKVDLIGAVHIADPAYYQTLNKRFEGYEVLLFEMIGGEGLGGGLGPAELPPAEPKEEVEPGERRQMIALRGIYENVARFLELGSQADHIDYSAKNFLHADLTAAEFERMQTERKESLLSFMLKADQAGAQPNPFKLILGLAYRRADVVKMAIIHTLGAGDDQVGSIAGESVVITDRNLRCLEVMNRELAAGHKNVGIFYGAAHFPDMEKRLLEAGFTRTSHEWLTAWNVPKPVKRRAAAPAAEP